MIVVKSLSKAYGKQKVVDNINFCISKGEIVALLGPNGAGKTTLMRLMTGFVEPDSGSVSFFGEDIKQNRLKCLSQMGYVPETGFLYADMRVYDFLKFCAEIRKLSKADFAQNLKYVLSALDLKKVINQKIETLSKGYKRRVGIAAALIHRPKVLILDEPTEGLDPNQKFKIHNFLQQYAKEAIIIISTHIMEEVEAMAQRVILLNHGKLVKDTTPQELKTLFPENNIAASFYKITNDSEVI